MGKSTIEAGERRFKALEFYCNSEKERVIRIFYFVVASFFPAVEAINRSVFSADFSML